MRRKEREKGERGEEGKEASQDRKTAAFYPGGPRRHEKEQEGAQSTEGSPFLGRSVPALSTVARGPWHIHGQTAADSCASEL